MKILITGASGYIGRNLAKYLAAQGDEVTALMRQSNEHVPAMKGVQIVEAPDYHRSDWQGEAVLKNHDVMIHTASRVHYRAETGEHVAQLYREDNVDLTLRLAALAQRAGVKRFLFLSSIGAQLLEDRFHEGHITTKAAWENHPYRMSKLEAERGLLRLVKTGAMATSCIRLPMVYGAGAPGSFSTLTRFMRKGIPLPFGSFKDARAFISIETVKDFVSYYLQHSGADGKIWAIRDGDEVSPMVFAAEMARAAQLPAPQFWTCPPWLLNLGAAFLGRHQTARSLAEPLHVNLEPVAKKLGWQPRLTVAEGLQKAFA